jgi:hypothetical protein
MFCFDCIALKIPFYITVAFSTDGTISEFGQLDTFELLFLKRKFTQLSKIVL